jgi:hypothetical protein
MGNRWISSREKELSRALKSKDVEELFWWIVKEHKQTFLQGEKSQLSAGLLRLALEHLSKLHMKRLDSEEPGPPEGSVAELERILRAVP